MPYPTLKEAIQRVQEYHLSANDVLGIILELKIGSDVSSTLICAVSIDGALHFTSLGVNCILKEMITKEDHNG